MHGCITMSYSADVLYYMHSYRRCLDTVINKVKNLPEYFEQFCSILKPHMHYKSFVTSIAISYTICNHEKEIQGCIQVDNVHLYLENLFTPSEIHAFSSDDNADRDGMNRKQYFITLLIRKSPYFNKSFMEYLALENPYCPQHIELYHLLKSLLDNLQEMFTITDVPKPSAAISKYQTYLKELYTEQLKSVAQDSFGGPHIEQYVNLSLIVTPELVGEGENDYFKVSIDPHEWLFKYKEKTSATTYTLKSISEIFDAFQVDRQVILIQGLLVVEKRHWPIIFAGNGEWADLYNNTPLYLLVILLKLRDPRIADMSHINELIKHSINDTDVACKALQEIESREGEGVLLILEGWDELSDDKQQKSLFSSIMSNNINVFNKAGVLITSRPSSIGTIKKLYVTRNIVILGFSDDQIEQYLIHYFTDPRKGLNSNLKKQFLAQLNYHSALKALARIPVNLSILVQVFKQCGEKLPNSLTKLYKKYILLKLNHDINHSEIIKQKGFNELKDAPPIISDSLHKLSKLAFYGLQKDRLIFTEEKIQKRCFPNEKIPSSYDGMGLLKVENHVLLNRVYKTYAFLHRTVQEFLAAWYLTDTRKQEMHLLDIFNDEAFHMVWIFYAGLTGFKNISINNIIALSVSEQKTVKIAMKTGSIIMKIGLKNSTASEINRFIEISNVYYSCVIPGNVSEEFLLVLIACCAEAQNPIACKELTNGPLFHKNMCCIEIPDSALTPQVLSSLSYCITRSDKKWRIVCPHLMILQDILNLYKYFTDDQKQFSGQLTSLYTNPNKNQMKTFLLLLSHQCVLAHLDFSCCKILDDDCVKILANALKFNKQLYILELRNCRISSQGLLTIAEMLTVNDTLEWLNLRVNDFTSYDLSQALTVIKGNTSLRFMEVDESLINRIK